MVGRRDRLKKELASGSIRLINRLDLGCPNPWSTPQFWTREHNGSQQPSCDRHTGCGFARRREDHVPSRQPRPTATRHQTRPVKADILLRWARQPLARPTTKRPAERIPSRWLCSRTAPPTPEALVAYLWYLAPTARRGSLTARRRGVGAARLATLSAPQAPLEQWQCCCATVIYRIRPETTEPIMLCIGSRSAPDDGSRSTGNFLDRHPVPAQKAGHACRELVSRTRRRTAHRLALARGIDAIPPSRAHCQTLRDALRSPNAVR